MHRNAKLAVILILVAGVFRAGAGAEYSISDLGTLAGPSSGADYINNNGWVTGVADDETVDPYSHAWVWTGSGALQDLGSFGGIQSVSTPSGINDSGWIAGQSDSGSATRGFVWTGSGTIQDIGTLGGQNTLPYGINNAGTIVGGSQVSSGTVHGFIYSNGVMTDLGPLYVPTAINNTGQLAGIIYPAPGDYNDIRGFIYSGGTYQDIGTLGGNECAPKAINDQGEITGLSLTGSGVLQAFVYTQSGGIRDLGTLGIWPEITSRFQLDSGMAR